jgi:hypothetical protein
MPRRRRLRSDSSMPDTQHLHNTPPPSGLPPGIPRDYAITVPGNWALVPLQPGVRQKAISSLIRRQFANIPGAGRFRAALHRHLTDLAEAAWQTGGIEFYLSLMTAGPIPVPASLIVTLIPPPPSGPLTVEALALEAKKRNRSVSLIQAPAGTGVGHRARPPTSPSTSLSRGAGHGCCSHSPVPAGRLPPPWRTCSTRSRRHSAGAGEGWRRIARMGACHTGLGGPFTAAACHWYCDACSVNSSA